MSNPEQPFTWEGFPEQTERTILDWLGEKFGGDWAPMDNVVYKAIKAVKTDGSDIWAMITFTEDETTVRIRHAIAIDADEAGDA